MQFGTRLKILQTSVVQELGVTSKFTAFTFFYFLY